MKHFSPPRMQVSLLPGGRLHLHDGPIDLIIVAEGATDAVRAAYAAATRRFATVLDELCAELPLLREQMRVEATMPRSPVARRMDAAVRPLCEARFITRMAAVAGSVADEILAAIVVAAPLSRAWVNNGGDIAVHLSPGAVFDVAMVGGVKSTRAVRLDHCEPDAKGRHNLPSGEDARTQCVRAGGVFIAERSTPHPDASLRPSPEGRVGASVARIGPTKDASLFGTTRITHADPVRGIATSGFGGRSFSLGIADAVTVLAVDAASADAAATLIANAVDLPGHPAISRAPASDFDPQSDLGDRFVTRSVWHLSRDEISAALDAGVREAERLHDDGRIVSAALCLRGQVRLAGHQERVATITPTPAPPIPRDSLRRSAAAHR